MKDLFNTPALPPWLLETNQKVRKPMTKSYKKTLFIYKPTNQMVRLIRVSKSIPLDWYEYTFMVLSDNELIRVYDVEVEEVIRKPTKAELSKV